MRSSVSNMGCDLALRGQLVPNPAHMEKPNPHSPSVQGSISQVCFLDSLFVFSRDNVFPARTSFICCCFCRWFCHWTRWQSGLLEKKDYSPELSGIIVHCVSVFSVSLNIGITCGSDVFTCPASFASTQTTSTVVDGVAVGYCDSNNTTAVTKQDWAKEFADKDPQHLQSYSQACKLSVPLSKALIDDLNKHFMKTEGVHVLQEMYGCKWDQGAKTSAHQQFAYDGEDFIRFDLDTASWVYTELATSYKRNWEKYFGFKEDLRRFLTNVCPQRLQQYLRHGLSALQRKVRPSVSLLQTSPSSPVSCHATGFYPDRATMFWSKDGEELHEDVDHGEILPNQDGTFQMTVYLDISSVKPEDWTRYDCVFQLSGAENKTMIKLDKTVIRTNWVLTPTEEPVNRITPVVVTAVVLVVILIVAVGFIFYKRNARSQMSHLYSFM
ncbi:hypothetical protein Q5P01_000959 [Channa striata]|uniref:Ig-like domain-containing protein n=1 Tax=Channa striata TaxID=64152 RepID=A0AA88ICT2_CHASR|nr:hypothetical protein Q5P01_000959 [Channa striata]